MRRQSESCRASRLVERQAASPQIFPRGRALWLAQFEALATNREHERRRRRTERIGTGREDRRRAHRVAGEGEIPRGSDRREDKRGRGRHARIDEQREITANEIGGVLGLQLKVRDEFDIVPRRRDQRFGTTQELRPERIVAATRIAPGENDEARHASPAAGWLTVPSESRRRMSTCRPAASTSSTSSGIWPSACVAQDRHGS